MLQEEGGGRNMSHATSGSDHPSTLWGEGKEGARTNLGTAIDHSSTLCCLYLNNFIEVVYSYS